MAVTLTWPRDGSGWLAGARHCLSPPADARADGIITDLAVIHYISLPDGFFRGPAIERLFTANARLADDPRLAELAGLQVSSHFLIRRHGELLQFVDVDRRAWHAGQSGFLGRQRCNDFSVGIELEGDWRRPFTASQYRRLRHLLALLQQRLPIRYVAGHSDIAPGRKQDPGPMFDWSQLDGLGLTRPWRDGRRHRQPASAARV
ncbi:MAG: 1,6-anhydro-N-acetylmuramyl-L-alanine amidase AmpD [Burkholderiaceae bacterium]